MHSARGPRSRGTTLETRYRTRSRYTALVYAVAPSACSTTKELVVLLPDEDGQTGAVAIGEQQRTTILDTPLGAAKIDTQGRVKKDRLTEEEVRQTFAPALAAQPPKPMSFLLYFIANSTEIVPSSQTSQPS